MSVAPVPRVDPDAELVEALRRQEPEATERLVADIGGWAKRFNRWTGMKASFGTRSARILPFLFGRQAVIPGLDAAEPAAEFSGIVPADADDRVLIGLIVARR